MLPAKLVVALLNELVSAALLKIAMDPFCVLDVLFMKIVVTSMTNLLKKSQK